jgi:hypothetical protein
MMEQADQVRPLQSGTLFMAQSLRQQQQLRGLMRTVSPSWTMPLSLRTRSLDASARCVGLTLVAETTFALC